MPVADEGIVLAALPYRNTSLIATLFLQRHGVTGVYVPGAYRPKARLPAAYFFPLSILRVQLYPKPGPQLKRLREASVRSALIRIRTVPLRHFYAHLLAEVAHRTLPPGYINAEAYAALREGVIHFETSPRPAAAALKVLLHYFAATGFDLQHSELAHHEVLRSVMHVSWSELSGLPFPRPAIHSALRTMIAFYESSQGVRLPLRSLALLRE